MEAEAAVREEVKVRVDTGGAEAGVMQSAVKSPLKSMSPMKAQNKVF